MPMKGICEGRVAIVTGAGGGIGREYALDLARQGTSVVVNDLGTSPVGEGASVSAAQAVADEIMALGGKAVANHEDVADWNGAQRLIEQAVSTFGTLDILVNNAGILRDRTIASMTSEEWDSVIRVHLRGTAGPSRFAAEYWRGRAKQTGQPTGARLINTSSASGLFGQFGQSNYGAAKAGIASFTLIAAKELASIGATANAIAPMARTRLTEAIMQQNADIDLRPEHIAPVVTWLASERSSAVTGRIFVVGGGQVALAEPWRLGPEIIKRGVWELEELEAEMPGLLSRAGPSIDIMGRPVKQ